MTDDNDNKNTERPMSASEVTAGTKIVRRAANQKPSRVVADICVVGSGAAGMSAAIEGARAGRKVVLVDSLPALGGQAVNSIIGTFCGLFSNGSDGYQFTHGIADDLLADLGAQENALFYRRGPHTTVVYYDEVALGRWVEKAILAAGVTVIVGAVMRNVRVAGRRVTGIDLSTRYGDVEVEANGFVDASGDAALVWQAGFACREPDDGPIYGTQMLIVENIDESKVPSREELPARMREKAGDYGLLRREGLSFVIPGRGVAAMNMTHVETPLEPLEASRKGIEGKDQADRAFAFLRNEFPACFGKARIRAYGFPGIRQTRWIVGRQQLSGHHWHVFDKDHVHYVPFGSLAPQEADNIVAAGRCIDADKAALSSVRVMGPCMAMGAAAAHALDLAGSGSVHQIDIDALKWRVRDNLERTD
jgi:2-polyprenyl-6-methoxyphenol hydroxylase-like FAD-dependent oxidoreductase